MTISRRIKVRLLILPKFDIGVLGDGTCGEGELFYKAYVEGGEVLPLQGLYPGERLYVKEGVALALTHAGKVNAATMLTAILTDPRLDCSEMRTLSVGCAGTNYELTTMGDVIVASAIVDYDLGHHVVSSEGKHTWYADSGLCEYGCVHLDADRIHGIYDLVRETPLHTTAKTIAFLRAHDTSMRTEPMVLVGAEVTSDNYWKGEDSHQVAKQICRHYGCVDEYLASDMEDAAVARVLERYGLIDGLVAIRVSVNLDCFMHGATAESLWSTHCFEDNMLEESNEEGADIFETAMRNLFAVGSRIADFMLGG